jgi:peptidoglycan/xylan/chitin deacetylase (PgdA/CDA1 family)
LTLDDGPVPGDTERLLDCLDDLRVPATFFCLGSNVERSPALVSEILSRGHVVGVHGYEHAHHLFRSPRWIARDLARAVAVTETAGASPVRWFRPPYGQTSGPTMWAAHRLGLRIVLWSAWGREWSAGQSDEVVRRVDAGLGPGTIVLLHDTDATSPPGTARRVVEALPSIVERLTARGLVPVTLDDLLMP